MRLMMMLSGLRPPPCIAIGLRATTMSPRRSGRRRQRRGTAYTKSPSRSAGAILSPHTTKYDRSSSAASPFAKSVIRRSTPQLYPLIKPGKRPNCPRQAHLRRHCAFGLRPIGNGISAYGRGIIPVLTRRRRFITIMASEGQSVAVAGRFPAHRHDSRFDASNFLQEADYE